MTVVHVPREMGNHVHVHGRALVPRTRRALGGLLSELLPEHRLASVRRLAGGLWAHSHALSLEPFDGGPVVRLVLRRYVRWDPSWGHDVDCARHAATLAALGRTPAPVPRLLWSDADAMVLDVPSLVYELLPGRSQLPTAASDRGLELMAQALVTVHRQEVDFPELGDRDGLVQWAGRVLGDGRMAAFLRDCPVADDVLDALRAGLPAVGTSPVVVSHGDFHPGNVLLSGRGAGLVLSGVVDWDVAGWAPRAADVGYCRADLTLAFGAGTADTFLAAYARGAGSIPEHLPWFELLAAARCWDEYEQWLPAYHAFGVPELTVATMRQRLTGFTAQALAAVDQS